MRYRRPRFRASRANNLPSPMTSTRSGGISSIGVAVTMLPAAQLGQL